MLDLERAYAYESFVQTIKGTSLNSLNSLSSLNSLISLNYLPRNGHYNTMPPHCTPQALKQKTTAVAVDRVEETT